VERGKVRAAAMLATDGQQRRSLWKGHVLQLRQDARYSDIIVKRWGFFIYAHTGSVMQLNDLKSNKG
jgi:hypothetical protein